MEHWKTLRRRTLLERPPRLTVFADDVQLPDGTVVRDYLRLETPDFVVIVPVDPGGRVGLIRSYKRGVGGVDLQPPAGTMEPNELPAQAAARELLEETGCTATEWQPLGSYVVLGNMRGGLVHIFLARGTRTVQPPASGDLEEQQLLWLDRPEVVSMWASGQFSQLSSASALGLAFAHLNWNLGSTE